MNLRILGALAMTFIMESACNQGQAVKQLKALVEKILRDERIESQ
jgi:hypothetical protein